jgi:hypothetical protein
MKLEKWNQLKLFKKSRGDSSPTLQHPPKSEGR